MKDRLETSLRHHRDNSEWLRPCLGVVTNFLQGVVLFGLYGPHSELSIKEGEERQKETQVAECQSNRDLYK